VFKKQAVLRKIGFSLLKHFDEKTYRDKPINTSKVKGKENTPYNRPRRPRGGVYV
jgi:hypothetical protein